MESFRFPVFRLILAILGVAAPFFFPVSFVVLLSMGIALALPPMALVMGGLVDIIYFDGVGIPYFTILGLVIGILAMVVQQFIKTRIIS